jgi:BREX system ATP-binding protein BrxC/D
MLLSEALSHYPDEDLDRLARDKVDEVSHLRLPREVLIQEISAALSSLGYVAGVLAPARPPTYAFLKSLLDAPGGRAAPQGLREAVLQETDVLTQRAESGEGLARGKEYDLYLRMLLAAWENEGGVDRSEALLLAALRKELGIWTREHLLLEHHPRVRPIWDSDRAFTDARNHLLATGLVLIQAGDYLLPEEVALQIRRAWDIDLADDAFRRLLTLLSVHQLRAALEGALLPLAGSKEERIDRLVRGLVPPAEVLDSFHINDVKDLCRVCGLPVSAAKADLIAGLIDHFDSGSDLARPDEVFETAPPPAQPVPRTLGDAELGRLLSELHVDLLYDLLAVHGLRRSGTKAERIQRLVASPCSERTLLGHLRRSELSELARRLDLPVSGIKDELIDRLTGWARTPAPADLMPVAPEPAAAPPAALSPAHPGPQLPSPKELPSKPVSEPPAGFSLTDREIERGVARHQLGWFLVKAHMAELIGRLRQNGSCPVRVRSTGSLNIYEWTDSPGDGEAVDIEQGAARDVIDALRQGVVPERHLDLLVVGQEAARQHLISLFKHVAQDRSEFKFLRGAYGAGKTFLCAWLRERAFEAGFAVSTVRVGPDQSLGDLPVFFSGLTDGLRTPEKRDASALADVLESWLLARHRHTAEVEGVPAFGEGTKERLAPLVEKLIEKELAYLCDLDPGFGPALRSFYRARLAGDHETASTAISWLRGSRSAPGSALAALGVRGYLEAGEVFPRMRALLEVIAGGPLRGLLLVIDELELVRRFPQARQRERAYETLRLLIDECGENRLPRCLLVSTGTHQLFDDERYGLASYQALAHRVAAPDPAPAGVSVRQPIIALDPLDRDRLLEVALRVRDIHGRAYDWPAKERVPHEVLERIADHSTAFAEGRSERLPRPFLRHVVHLLDLCEEQPALSADSFLPGPAEVRGLAESVLSALAE